jgi:hypothetical protein
MIRGGSEACRARGALRVSIAFGMTVVRLASQVPASSPMARSLSVTQIVTVVARAITRSAVR